MRALQYKLENGNIVNTLKEAVASGLRYSASLEVVAEAPLKMTEKRAAARIKLK